MNDINELIDNYYKWLKDKTVWEFFGEWAEITTPYLDRNNDYIQIYLKKSEDGYLLTDDSATIAGLAQEGCLINNEKRKKILQLTLRAYGVVNEKDALQIKATLADFPLRKHSLVQAILAVNDMFYLASPHTTSLFLDDLSQWLNSSKIRYSSRLLFQGRSGYSRTFDFLISKSPQSPERIIKAMNDPSKNRADAIIMDWIDVKDSRDEGTQAYAIINDSKQNISDKVVDALEKYGVYPALWSKKEDYKKRLAA